VKDLYLIAEMAGTMVAIPTQDVEAVVSVGETVPVPAAPSHVAGLFALRSRVITLIDPAQLIARKQTRLDADSTAIIGSIGGNVYGFLIDKVDDVLTIPSDQIMDVGGATDAWARLATGVAAVEGRDMMMVVSLGNFIHLPRQMAA
jgi:purine-binding chemotaxis protein CheW